MKIKIVIWLMFFTFFTGYSSLNAEVLKSISKQKLVIGYSGSPSNIDFGIN